MQTYLEFLQKKQERLNNQIQFNEAFQRKDAEKALDLISKLLKKHIKNLVPIKPLEQTTIDGKACTSKYFLVNPTDEKDAMMFTMNWLVSSKSAEVYSIEFYKDMNLFWGGKGKSSLSIYTMGSSIVHFLPVIWTVVNDRKFNLKDDDVEKISKQIYSGSTNESASFKFYVGGLGYTVLEHVSADVIEDTFLLNVNEAGEDAEVKAYRAQKKMERDNADRKRKQTGREEDRLEFKRLHAEYDDIVHAIKAGAKTMADLKFAIKNNITCAEQVDDTIKKAEEEFESEKKDPDQVFKEMQKYVKMVIKGLQPSVILCGAPGVGKTFRVKQQLKASGYVNGQNMFTIKGKCSPRVLYKTLYEFQDRGQIVVIDDADGLVGPKAPEDVINILKAALDSTEDDEGRQVSYGVSGKILDDEDNEIPKTFFYRGGVIIITNYTAGQLDTALRGRSFVQDIHFTTEDILNIVKKLMPAISPERFSMKSKLKAMDYLQELYDKGQTMDLSIRTFTLCCKVYETSADDEDFTDDDARSMIREQMKMQSLRGGKKY